MKVPDSIGGSVALYHEEILMQARRLLAMFRADPEEQAIVAEVQETIAALIRVSGRGPMITGAMVMAALIQNTSFDDAARMSIAVALMEEMENNPS